MPVARGSTTPSARVDAREVVAGVGEPEVTGRRIEHRVEAGDEHVRRHLGAQELVGPAQHGARVDQAGGVGAQDAVGGGHHHGGRHALVGDVADHEPDATLGQRDEVVEVAADLPSRPVVRASRVHPSGAGASCGRNCFWMSVATFSSWSIRSRAAPARRGAARGARPGWPPPRCPPGCRAAGGHRGCTDARCAAARGSARR